MKRFFSLAVLATLSTLIANAVVANAQSSYSFTDLGTQGGSAASAAGINNSGKVIIRALVGPSDLRVILVDTTIGVTGQMLPLPSGWTYSTTNTGSINSNGQVAGTALPAPNTAPQCAIAWSANGSPTLLTSTKNQNGTGYGLNDGGDVVGSALAGKSQAPFLWQYANGTYSAVQLASSGYATAVNNLRQVIGPTFLWLPSAAYGLPRGMNALTGILTQNGKNINNSGLIAGIVPSSSHLCLWVPAGGGAAYGLADGVNDLGGNGLNVVAPSGINNPPVGKPLQIVGWMRDNAGLEYAFTWDSATKTVWNLNALATNMPAGWVLKGATGVNEMGQIVGYASYNGSPSRAFLLTPQ